MKRPPKKLKQTRFSWNHVLLILVLLALVIVVASVPFFSGVAGAARGGGTKKSNLPDLAATGAVLQNLQKSVKDNVLLYQAQEGVGVANVGEARSKASLLRAGVKGDSLGNVRASVFYADSTGKLITSATTEYVTVTNSGAFVDINVDPLMPASGPGVWTKAYSALFSGLPINMPTSNGTVTETYFVFYIHADPSSLITESNKENNYKENTYIFRCA